MLSGHQALGLRDHLDADYELVVITSDDELDEHLEDVEVIISSPFLAVNLTKERQEKAKNLKLAITAGAGPDM